MRALKFYQTGSLDDLRIEEVPPPIPGDGRRLYHGLGSVGQCRQDPSGRDGANPRHYRRRRQRRRPDCAQGRDSCDWHRRKASDIPPASFVPVNDWIDLQTTDLAPGTRKLTDGRGADVVFDLVGGAMFEKCLAALAWRGRQVAISSSPEPRVSFNLVDFYHNESRLLGVDSLKLSFEETAEILRQLTSGFETGIFPPPPVETFSLAEGPRLYREVAESQVKGKPVLVP
jgi:Zinc-binding dehydrogenase